MKKLPITTKFAIYFLVGLLVASFVVPAFLPESHKTPSDLIYANPTFSHPFGTDINGRDQLYRILLGARVSLIVGILGALISFFIGTAYGMISGFFGGKIDEAMMRFVDIFYSIPRLLFILIFMNSFDFYAKGFIGNAMTYSRENGLDFLANTFESCLPYSRIGLLIICLGLIEWLTMARIVRGQVLSLKERGFVLASRSLGQSKRKIMVKHILPNAMPVALTYLTLTIPAVMLDESFLSFLGLGIEAPAASWGTLLKDGSQVINPLQSSWWLLFFPAFFMVSSLFLLHFIGNYFLQKKA